MSYQYRNFACNIVPDGQLWFVGGRDIKDQSGGVLEWCVNEADAKYIMQEMNKDKGRFQNLTCGLWKD